MVVNTMRDKRVNASITILLVATLTGLGYELFNKLVALIEVVKF
jgi:hypothetical protein